MTLAALEACYQDLLAICDDLEAIADGLPNSISRARCAQAAGEAVLALARTHRLENEVLLPQLETSPRPELRHLATRLRQEHDFDGQAVMEIEEALLALSEGRAFLSPDALGYLLRSFFESVRRHVHTEQDLISLLNDISPPPGSMH